ncbi:MAG TPA: RNase adapter RapZ [Desulfobacteraceae bacterium]|nr:RNase adapter RapZ [Desulfobacteraceae bacterium]|tara:strand:- start:100 stop:981 length:882 start_codon:yes stop_codon:yes gene_type:complete
MTPLRVYIITGISGSGKSTVVQAFEDASFYCIDNMPMELVPKVLELPFKDLPEVKGAAFVMDLRSKTFVKNFVSGISALEEMGITPTIIFLEADNKTLVTRYSQTRRQHPLDSESRLLDNIKAEKEAMRSIRRVAHHIIDTSQCNVHRLKSVILDMILEADESVERMKINILSFGYKYGIPLDADLMMDLRFLNNPYFVPELKPLDGESEAVKSFVINDPETQRFLDRFYGLIDYLIPMYKKENKAYLTLAMGCTGGRHRSVAIARALFERLTDKGMTPSLVHRDIDRDIKEL